MSEKRELDTRDNIRIVTHNNLITAQGFPKMSVKARKLLYLTISQCKKDDTEFYQYEITVNDFAVLMGIKKTHVYQEADKITDELASAFLTIQTPGKQEFKKRTLMTCCDYANGVITMELNPRMTDILLNLKGSFTQPLLSDFMHMNSAYSMAIWHLMQREMKSTKPGSRRIDFYLSLDELREVTGTTDKLIKISHFKERVLDKAIREIYDNIGIIIEYDLHKAGRKIIGFDFHAYYAYHGMKIDLMDYIPE